MRKPKKASGMAMSMLSHYPDKLDLVNAMVELAIEELAHFREVIKLMQHRHLQLGRDEKDPYIHALRKHPRWSRRVFTRSLINSGYYRSTWL